MKIFSFWISFILVFSFAAHAQLLYAALILLAAIPMFYFITYALCIQDVDEALGDRRVRLAGQLSAHDVILNSLPWHDLNKEIVIYPPIGHKSAVHKPVTLRYRTFRKETEPFRELHSSIQVHGQTYPVVLRISLIGTEDLIQGIMIAATLLLVLILGGLLFINRILSRKIWQPFYQALDQLKKFTLEEKGSLKFTDTDISEFRDLQSACLSLTSRVSQAYRQQKEFTENAAHELQTPLASLKAVLEVMIQDEHLTRKQFAQLENLEHTVLRMSRQNRQLLLLAKIENRQFSETVLICPEEIIKGILKRHDMEIQMKKIQISETYRPLEITGNLDMLEVLFSNLLMNALRYSPEEEVIFIKTGPKGVEISNTGTALPFSKEKLFQRFQKNYSDHLTDSNGRGLAIVWQICRVFHYHIQYRYLENKHQFILTF